MKTPQSEEKDLDKDGKSKKNQMAAAASGKTGGTTVPGFGMANVVTKPNGSYVASAKCINGNTARNFTAALAAGITYYNSRERVPSPSDISIYLPDGATIDTNFIFPWSPILADPLRLGGGVINGTLSEGAQRIIDPTVPLMNPILITNWINGTPWRISVTVTDTFGLTLFEGTQVFALITKDPVSGTYVVRAMALREGACLDLTT